MAILMLSHRLLQGLVFSLAILGISGYPSNSDSSSPLPLVIWHGLGDKYDAEGLAAAGKLAQKVNPGTFVYNIRVSNDSSEDQRATFFGNVNEQLDGVCNALSSHPVLNKAPAINAMGFSQGGQFIRAYVERCNNPPVRNLVTFGSQHNGISKFQTCQPLDLLCKGAQYLLESSTWSDYVQTNLVPAQYFRDPDDLESYLQHSNFLADINNERDVKNASYKIGIQNLNKFVMFYFESDQTVHPKESGWFFEVNTTAGMAIPLKDRPIYTEDWIGLKALDEKNGLVFKVLPGQHMNLREEDLREIFDRYFSPVPGLTWETYNHDDTATASKTDSTMEEAWLEL